MMERLRPVFGTGEAKAIIRLIFHHLKGWDTTALIINEDKEAGEYIRTKINAILDRLDKNEPIQYILGEAYFYGMNLKVDCSTLIPRPETAELVDQIVKENESSDLRVLDIGTGSGAIAIALSRNLLFPTVTAIDISPDALRTASENARILHARINFINEDIFRYTPRAETFDIIVSNPPYIGESEKKEMNPNVVDYEPHSALFVPDDEPLLYYSRISAIARTALTDGGKLYFEINPLYASELSTALEKEGFSDVTLINDIHARERFIKCRLYRNR